MTQGDPAPNPLQVFSPGSGSLIPMRLYVAVTDNNWFALHASKATVEEVNFWRPSPDAAFKVLQPGELLLFKLHAPENFIAGAVPETAAELPLRAVTSMRREAWSLAPSFAPYIERFWERGLIWPLRCDQSSTVAGGGVGSRARRRRSLRPKALPPRAPIRRSCMQTLAKEDEG